MIFDLFNPRILPKTYVGKWKGKGCTVIQPPSPFFQFIYSNTINEIEIKYVNEFTYSINAKTITEDGSIYEQNFLSFLNKKTEILEGVNPDNNMPIGINQFYFNDDYLIFSFSVVNSNGSTASGTVKLLNDYWFIDLLIYWIIELLNYWIKYFYPKIYVGNGNDYTVIQSYVPFSKFIYNNTINEIEIKYVGIGAYY